MPRPAQAPQAATDAQLEITRDGSDALVIRLSGHWLLSRDLPDLLAAVQRQEPGRTLRRIGFDAAGLQAWDSMLIAEVRRLKVLCAEHKITIDLAGLPDGAHHLIDLATAVPERQPTNRRTRGRYGFRTAVGVEVIRAARSTGDMIGFLGETILALVAALRGRARFRWADLFQVVQENGPAALPIVGWSICWSA
ncbi:MAG: hypothetical protein WDO24_24865 [Pseudomonadota bacterium]